MCFFFSSLFLRIFLFCCLHSSIDIYNIYLYKSVCLCDFNGCTEICLFSPVFFFSSLYLRSCKMYRATQTHPRKKMCETLSNVPYPRFIYPFYFPFHILQKWKNNVKTLRFTFILSGFFLRFQNCMLHRCNYISLHLNCRCVCVCLCILCVFFCYCFAL